MAWSITDRFPSWGEAGESPADGFFYSGGDQVNEKHLDYLWNSVRGLEDDVQAALSDIDSNADGIVDEADYANDADASTYKGTDIDSNGDGKVDAADSADSANQLSDPSVHDASEFSGSNGTDGQALLTDGTNAIWGTAGITQQDADEAALAYDFIMG